MTKAVTKAWLERPEGGSAWALRLFTAIALGLGRTVSRLILLPITAYFLLRRAPERRASRAYLARVLGHLTDGVADLEPRADQREASAFAAREHGLDRFAQLLQARHRQLAQ